MIYQLHWQNRSDGKSCGIKYQFEVNDAFSRFQRNSKVKQNIREAQTKFPIPEGRQKEIVWMLCTDESEHFQGVLAEDS